MSWMPIMQQRRKAAVKAAPVFDLRGTTQACLEKTSRQVNKYLLLLLYFDKDQRSAKSACHRSSIPTVNIPLRLNFNLTGLCKVYASLFCNHVSMSLVLTDPSTCRLKVCTPPKLPACLRSKYEFINKVPTYISFSAFYVSALKSVWV